MPHALLEVRNATLHRGLIDGQELLKKIEDAEALLKSLRQTLASKTPK